MNHTEAAQYIKATLTAFGQGEAISMTKETWAKIHEAMQVLTQPEQEPVATVLLLDGEKIIDASMKFFDEYPIGTELFLFPPQRTWVGLTDEEIRRIELTVHGYRRQPLDVKAFARAIEAKLKKKNT